VVERSLKIVKLVVKCDLQIHLQKNIKSHRIGSWGQLTLSFGDWSDSMGTTSLVMKSTLWLTA
jgi:hypothetical protein